MKVILEYLMGLRIRIGQVAIYLILFGIND